MMTVSSDECAVELHAGWSTEGAGGLAISMPAEAVPCTQQSLSLHQDQSLSMSPQSP